MHFTSRWSYVDNKAELRQKELLHRVTWEYAWAAFTEYDLVYPRLLGRSLCFGWGRGDFILKCPRNLRFYKSLEQGLNLSRS